MQTIRAIYEDGQLRLLDRVSLHEGEQVNITILSNRDRIRAILKDQVDEANEGMMDDLDLERLRREVEEGFKGVRSLSEIIIEERCRTVI
jgi:predicted DNA-binding antitoxin AbrB/MazE fold protein